MRATTSLRAGALCSMVLGCSGAAAAHSSAWQVRAEQALHQALTARHPGVVAWHITALVDTRQQQRLAERVVTRAEVAGTGKRSAVRLWCENAARSCATVWFAVRGEQAVLSSRRTVPALQPVAAADFVLQPRDVMNLRCAPLTTAADLAGLRTKRALSAGAAVCRELFEARPAVSRGESVEVRAAAGAVAITTRAIAQQDAMLGQRVRVKRIDSSSAMLALVVGTGRVVIGDRYE